MTTATLAPPAAEPLHTTVTEHAPVPGPPESTSPHCHHCSYRLNEWTLWPCAELRLAADVVEVPNGWSIRPRPAVRARRPR
jgi:hypothetical protein